MDPMTRRKAMMMLAASSGGGGQGILPVEWENSKLKFSADQVEAIQSGQMFSFSADGVVLIGYVSKFPYSDSYQSAGEVLFAYGENLYRGCLIFDSETTAYFNAAPNGASPANPSSLEVITLPHTTSADNGKVLGVANGAWGAVNNLPVIAFDNDSHILTYTESQLSYINSGKPWIICYKSIYRCVCKAVRVQPGVISTVISHIDGDFYGEFVLIDSTSALLTRKSSDGEGARIQDLYSIGVPQYYTDASGFSAIDRNGRSLAGTYFGFDSFDGAPSYLSDFVTTIPVAAEIVNQMQPVIAMLMSQSIASGSASGYVPIGDSGILEYLLQHGTQKSTQILFGSTLFTLRGFTYGIDPVTSNEVVTQACFVSTEYDDANVQAYGDLYVYNIQMDISASWLSINVEFKTIPVLQIS